MSILNSLKELAGNELVGGLASHLGESNEGVSKALGGIFPTVLSSLMNAKQEDHGMLGNLLSKAGGDGGSLVGSLLGGLTGGGASSGISGIGSSLVSGLLGNKLGGVANLIGTFAGVKSSSASSLMGIGGSLIASFLGKKMLGDGGGIGGILKMLTGHKDEIAAAAPSGLAGALGLSSLFGGASDAVGKVASAATSTVSNAAGTISNMAGGDDNKGGGMKWLWPLLLLGLLAAGIWWAMGKGCNGSKESDAAANTEMPATTETSAPAEGAIATDANAASTTATAEAPAATTAKESLKVKLADGVEINAFKGGVEDKLVAFLNTPGAKLDAADKTKDWYDFDNLNFDLGKATITKESMVQIDNLVAILKAYPKLKIKVGGYTDKKGDDKANMSLSQSRADAVFAALKGKGANAAQLVKAEGYGETLAVVDENASDEERRKDRRTAVRILEK
jgi:outer membrane protein OmpA-like peptidoglycan-associated protein